MYCIFRLTQVSVNLSVDFVEYMYTLLVATSLMLKKAKDTLI